MKSDLRGWSHYRARLAGFPAPGAGFPATPTPAVAQQMRAVYWLMIAVLVVGVALIGSALIGHPLPLWATTPLAFAVAGYMLLGTSESRHNTLSGFLFLYRSETTTEWDKVGVPFTDWWRVSSSPVPWPTLATYYAVWPEKTPSKDRTAPLWLPMVWWMVQHDISPAMLAAQPDAKHPADVVYVQHRCKITTGDWARLRAVYAYAPTPTLMNVLDWARGSRATLHPNDFTGSVVDGQVRSVESGIEVLEAWHRAGFGELNHASSTVSADVVNTPRDVVENVRRFEFERLDVVGVATEVTTGTTVQAWVETCGELAPWFILAGIDFEHASVMVGESPEDVSVEMLQVLITLHNTEGV